MGVSSKIKEINTVFKCMSLLESKGDIYFNILHRELRNRGQKLLYKHESLLALSFGSRFATPNSISIKRQQAVTLLLCTRIEQALPRECGYPSLITHVAHNIVASFVASCYGALRAATTDKIRV